MAARSRSRVRNAAEYALATILLASLRGVPRGAAERLARIYTALLDRTVPRLRRIALRNLEIAGIGESDEERNSIADGVFRSIARLLVAFSRLPRIRKHNVGEWIRYEGLEYFHAALEQGKGVLIATAHLGNWELSAHAHGLMSGRMSVVVRALDNPLIDRLVERYRSLSGNRIIEKKDFARGILKSLAENEAVGILIDQNTSPEQGAFVDFFGVPACSATGFAKIASRSGAPVIPGFALWNERERMYILRFYPPVRMTGDAIRDTQALQEQLEGVIRQHPCQWLWIHRRWKTRPPGSPPLY